MTSVTFGGKAKRLMYEALNKSVDGEGYLVETLNPKQRVLTKDGEFIKPNEVGIVRPGSQIFIKKDIVSLIKFASDLI